MKLQSRKNSLPRKFRILVESACILDLLSVRVFKSITFAILTIFPAFSYAEFVPSNDIPSEFRLSARAGIPFLEFPISDAYGMTDENLRGVGYISCVPRRIDVFRFNLVLETPMPNYYLDATPIFVGLRSISGNMSSVVGSAPTDDVDEPPSSFGFLTFVKMYPDVVRDYDPFSVSRYQKLYMSSSISANFLQALKSNNQMMMISRDQGESTYFFNFMIQLKLGEETANRFLNSCLQMGEN